jgi:hypothetical protein
MLKRQLSTGAREDLGDLRSGYMRSGHMFVTAFQTCYEPMAGDERFSLSSGLWRTQTERRRAGPQRPGPARGSLARRHCASGRKVDRGHLSTSAHPPAAANHTSITC